MKKDNVLFLLADGFEEIEALATLDACRRAGLNCVTASIMPTNIVRGAHDIRVTSDANLADEQVAATDWALIVLPGGMPGSTNLRDDERVIKLLQKTAAAGKYIAAICAAPIVLARAGLIEGKRLTSYPGFAEQLPGAIYVEDAVCQDDRLITARGPALALPFAFKIIEVLCGKNVADEVAAGMLWPMLGKA
ncbi:MAG: DJ-1/PfpI family protein [Clostridiaceae bacterium]|nr:DJ-1/PfpI family protein [Clostridiaceae bacterium]